MNSTLAWDLLNNHLSDPVRARIFFELMFDDNNPITIKHLQNVTKKEIHIKVNLVVMILCVQSKNTERSTQYLKFISLQIQLKNGLSDMASARSTLINHILR